MLYIELKAVASRRGLVRWAKSGLVEQLRIGRQGTVLAKNLVTSKEHPIQVGRKDYFCVEAQPQELVRLGDLLPIKPHKMS